MTDIVTPSVAHPPDPHEQMLSELAVGVSPSSNPLVTTLLQLLDAAEQLVAVKDIDTWRYVYVNSRMASFLGRAAAEVVGRSDLELLDAEKTSVLRAADFAAAAEQAPVRSDHRFEISGARRDFTATRLVLLPPDGTRPRLQLSTWTETTASRQQEAQLRSALDQVEESQRTQVELRQELRDQALRDHMTGLYHHGHFQDQLRREVDLSTREHREFSLVSIALDPPDERLREAGPEGRQRVLEALGRLLRGNTRAMDASCQLDGEHFSVLLSGVGLATAHARMDGLRRQCASQVVVQDGRNLGFTISMGVASFPHTSTNQEELIDAADKALVQALAKGNYVALASIPLE